jgi:hypothetical protein
LKTDQNWQVSGIFSEYAKAKERYFMTQEDQDLVIGRVVRERKEAETRLAALREEAHKYGELFAYVGGMLQTNPEHIMFEQAPIPLEFQSRQPLMKHENLSSAKVYKLVSDIQETMLTLKRINDNAGRLGI